MAVVNVVKKELYMDSVFLMSLSNKLEKLPGVLSASVMMGTFENKKILSSAGLLTEEGKNASANDLVVAVKSQDVSRAQSACKKVDEFISEEKTAVSSARSLKGLEDAFKTYPGINLVHISIPGKYVRREAEYSLKKGKNVFIFSDNVSLEDEVALKKLGKKKGLFVMGPDCGTAIINGIGLGFANAVRRGNIGIVAASGTGIQEVSSLIHNLGGGISQAVGTGGRDLKKEVGGIMAEMGIKSLIADKNTDVIVVVSKLPDEGVQKKILSVLKKTKKPSVVLFLSEKTFAGKDGKINFAKDLTEAACKAVELSIGKKVFLEVPSLKAKIVGRRKYLRALYSGGTLTNEANLILSGMGVSFKSNVPLNKNQRLKNPFESEGNTTLDMGDDIFTVGVPHPMIDFTVRNKRILKEAASREVAIILLDVVLGYGSHPDPAAALHNAVEKAKRISKGEIVFIASVCGTDLDPQVRSKQVKALEKLGFLVAPSNAAAVRLAGGLLK